MKKVYKSITEHVKDFLAAKRENNLKHVRENPRKHRKVEAWFFISTPVIPITIQKSS
jgi:hypothetical protein